MDPVSELLLRRRGLLFLSPGAAGAHQRDAARALAIELAGLGYVPSARLEARVATLAPADLVELYTWVCGVLAEAVGGGRAHVPLFRKFPHDVPADTRGLWIQKVVVHFLGAPEQPCLFCRVPGTTHVLDPCGHVVCDRCFDGANYSACPVCEHAVDRSSPFFHPSPERPLPDEAVRFRLLDLGEDPDDEARALFLQLCARKQALSPDDREALATLVWAYGERVLAWVPNEVPVKENVAIVLGNLFRVCDPELVLPAARRLLRTATDVLRLVAVFSGADASLQAQRRQITVQATGPDKRWHGRVGAALRRCSKETPGQLRIQQRTARFPVAQLRRPLRRALLAILDGLAEESLLEDMLRHRALWVWLGQFLHPHEYAKRFPKAARAFAVVRGRDPQGTPAPVFRGFASKLEAAVAARDTGALLALLSGRPGELARRLDHLLRLAGEDREATGRVLAAFEAAAPKVSTPVLLTLRSVLSTRARPQTTRIYWPAGAVSKGVSAPETRAPLAADLVAPAIGIAEAELLRRYAAKPAQEVALIDLALRTVIAPFNERTASRAAVALPRGSTIEVPRGKTVRLFLHWCEPEGGGATTDLDLSVGFYDAAWAYVGRCSYSELQLLDDEGEPIARSAGDLRSAPPPDGATEFIDVLRDRAGRRGIRYAAMTVNAFRGLAFSALERAFAGLMFRDDAEGAHFDPRTVELKFDLQGESGVYLPCVLDLETDRLHWLDVYQQGQFQFNTVEGSTRAITTVCPRLIDYFASGARSSVLDLALLHAAARSQRVVLRGEQGAATTVDRDPSEAAASYLRRLVEAAAAGPTGELPDLGAAPVFAALYRGDLALPEGSPRYVLFPEQVTGSLAGSDLIG